MPLSAYRACACSNHYAFLTGAPAFLPPNAIRLILLLHEPDRIRRRGKLGRKVNIVEVRTRRGVLDAAR